MAERNWHFVQKFIIVGSPGAGKTSLMFRLTDAAFREESEPTIGVDFGGKILTLDDGKRVKIQIWDTAGQESFRSITKSYYRGCEGCLLVFDVTYRQSFLDLRSWIADIREFAPEEAVVMLVANKIDLTTGENAVERAVAEEEILAFAHEHNLEFCETSAKSGKGVEEAFETVAKAIHARAQANKAAAKRKEGRSFPLAASNQKAAGQCC